MLRAIAAVVLGLVVWNLTSFAGLLALRLWPDYAAAEPTLSFSALMLMARQVNGLASLVPAAVLAALVATSPRRGALALGIVAVILMLPVHAHFWSLFPIWYHLPFLALLIPVSLLGGHLGGVVRRTRSSISSARYHA